MTKLHPHPNWAPRWHELRYQGSEWTEIWPGCKAAGRRHVTLFWPPARSGDHNLIVDGIATDLPRPGERLPFHTPGSDWAGTDATVS